MSELKIVEAGNLLNMQQASEYLNIKISSLYAMCMKKTIPFVKIGRLNRFKLQSLDKWIESHIQGKA